MEITRTTSRLTGRAFTVCIIAYVLAVLVAIGVGYVFRGLHPVYIVLLADIAGTLVIYFTGRIFRNASFYDPYWSVAPIVIAFFWIFVFSGVANTARQIIVATLVCAWGFRLTYNWARRWHGFNHEDWRYEDLRHKTGKWFWFVELMGIEMMPTIIVFLGCLSLYPALVAGRNSFGIIDVIAIIVTLSSIIIEAIADEQLRDFMKKKPAPEEIFTGGLWAYSRHPNYFGEVAFWWGLFFFGLAADAAYWWTIIGPVLMTALFVFISVPMIEKHNLSRRPGYVIIQKKISPLIPWFPQK